MQMVYNSTKRNDSTLKQNSKQKENHKDDGKQVYLLKLVLCFCYFAQLFGQWQQTYKTNRLSRFSFRLSFALV